MAFLIVFLGAGIGGALRHGTNLLAAALLGTSFPYGTLAVNVVGSFIMAIIAETFALKAGLPQEWRLFLTTGLLGGFTTFSSFSLDTMTLWERGDTVTAFLYVALSIIVSFAAFVLGLWLIRTLLGAGA